MNSKTLVKPPRTLMEVFKVLPEGTLVQLIENELVMSPSPLDVHQKVMDKIYRQLGNFIEKNNLGETRPAPYDVYFDDQNAFQPDIIFIATENLNKIKKDGLYGAPDLVIEIASPSTAKYDLEKKKDVYEKYGVKEYWIVDPSNKSVKGFSLVNYRFSELPGSTGIIHSVLLNKSFSF